MRPVNLIPEERRKGHGPSAVGTRSGIAVYILLAVLAAAVLAIAALVLTSNKVNDREGELATLKQEEQAAVAAAAALRGYGDFVEIANNRQETVAALAGSRFNWERFLRQLSRTIPSDAWLTEFNGSVSSDVEGSGGGDSSGLRSEVPGPAVKLTGCTSSQGDVARMMVRMRNIDGVTRVVLEKSGNTEEEEDADASGAAGLAAGDSGGASSDCKTSQIVGFEILLIFGGVALPGSVPGSGAVGQAPSPVAKAEAAAGAADSRTSAGSSSSAGGGP